MSTTPTIKTATGTNVIHYSCDRCLRSIDPDVEIRYVVRVEIQAQYEETDLIQDNEDDHLLEINEILERLEDAECAAIGEDVYQKRKYDLCPDCYRQYSQNPLALDTQVPFRFSDN